MNAICRALLARPRGMQLMAGSKWIVRFRRETAIQSPNHQYYDAPSASLTGPSKACHRAALLQPTTSRCTSAQRKNRNATTDPDPQKLHISSLCERIDCDLNCIATGRFRFIQKSVIGSSHLFQFTSKQLTEQKSRILGGSKPLFRASSRLFPACHISK